MQPFDRLIGQGLLHEAFHLPHTRGTGDIDLAQHAADDVDPDKKQALSAQGGSEGIANLMFALGELRCFCLTTHRQIATEFTG